MLTADAEAGRQKVRRSSEGDDEQGLNTDKSLQCVRVRLKLIQTRAVNIKGAEGSLAVFQLGCN